MEQTWQERLLGKALARDYAPEAVAWRAKLRGMMPFLDHEKVVADATDSGDGLFHVFTDRNLCGQYYLPTRKGELRFGLDFDARHHAAPKDDEPGGAELFTFQSDGEPFAEILRSIGYPDARWRPCQEGDRMWIYDGEMGGAMVFTGKTLTPFELCDVGRKVVQEIVRACDVTQMDLAMLERARIDPGKPSCGSHGRASARKAANRL